MSETAARFCKKKPTISAQVEIAEHFQAMEAEHADVMAMLADIDLDYSGRFQTEYFFAEDDPRFERWVENNRSLRPLITVETLYTEDDDYRLEQEDEYDRRCEDAAADRYEFGYERY